MRAWVGLEALFNNGQTEASHPQITLMSEASTKLQQLLGKMQDLGFTNGDPLPVQSSTLESLNAPLLWSLVPSLYTGLIHLSSIYRHQGMFQEAVKNMDDALKAVEAVEATPLVFHALSVYGDLKMRAGETAEGVEMLERAIKMEAEVDKRKELTALDCSLGYMHRLEEAHDDEFDRYCHAEATLDELMGPSFISGIDGVSSAEAELLDSLEKLDLQTQASPPPPPSKRTLSRKSPKKAAKAPAKPSTKPAPKGVFGECSTLQKLKGNLLRLKAYNMSIQEQFDEAERFLRESEMEKVPHGYHELFFEHMARAKNTLSKVIYDLKHHVGLNLLMESSIFLPS